MRRRYVLGGMFAFLAAVAAVTLADVLATVFFAVTVAYLLAPMRAWFVARGVASWWASLAATALAFAAAVAVVAPLVAVLILRLDVIVDLIQSAPNEVSFELFGLVYAVTLAEMQAFLTQLTRSTARMIARAAPVLGLKFSLFVLLVFSLVNHQREARHAVLAVVPPAYRDVAEAFNDRIRSTLFAIYVLQAATAAGTFVIAVPFFVAVGYSFPFALAVAAGILQFLPVVGPSVLLVALAAYHVSVGQVTTALLVLVVGGTLIAWLPDLVIRPRLARTTANMPGSLYFIGFVGGLLSLGTVGVIAGPLAIALLVEAANLLSEELNEVAVAGPDVE